MSEPELNDDLLLARYGEGEALAARLLTQRLAPKVLSFTYRMLGDRNEAEDVTQEALMRLWQAAPGWQPGVAKVSTWLYRVARNLVIDRLRKRRGHGLQALDDSEDPMDDGPSAEQQLLTAQRLEALDAALQQLPERQREAVILRHIEGLANPEIAEIFGIGVEAVESLTARAKRNLAALLSSQRDALGYQGEG